MCEYCILFTEAIKFTFEKEKYILTEDDGVVRVCITPNRTISCDVDPPVFLYLVTDYDNSSTAGIVSAHMHSIVSCDNLSICSWSSKAIAQLYSKIH